MSRAKSDLTPQEQTNVRAAIRFLHARCGGWVPLGKILRINDCALSHIARREPVSASVAFRVARLAKVSIDDLLAGRYPPPGACPHCGHVKDPSEVEGVLP